EVDGRNILGTDTVRADGFVPPPTAPLDPGGDLDASYEVATVFGLTNRLDLMNQRAQLVDAWRQIAVTANSLLGVFNVEYHLTAFSPVGQAKPLALDGSRVEHQLILTGQLPLVRKAERNIYRAALIAFQQSRRDLMALEDSIALTIRREIRQLRVLAKNYEIQQKLVELGYKQVESTEEALYGPAEPPAPAALIAPPGRTNAANAAALANQLLSAQQNLVGRQNQLLVIWTNYLNTRMQLYRDLELMPLDFRGVWIDELATREPPRFRDGAHAVPAGEWPAGGAEQSGQPAPARLPARLLTPTGAPLTPQ